MPEALIWLRTLRYVRPSMLVARARSAVRRMLRTAFPGPAARHLARVGASAPELNLLPFAGFFSSGLAGEGREDALDLQGKKLRLMGVEIDLAPEVDWRGAGLSRQARWKLHAFGYLGPLAGVAREGPRAEAWASFRRLVAGWIRRCRVPAGDAWASYPTSVRAVNWLKCAAAFGPEMAKDDGFRPALAKSLYAHGSFLERNVEWHLRCNHLVENARALLFLGSAFGDARARRWRAAAGRILGLAVKEQFLGDGCHVERSPMYHLAVLEGLLDCVEVVQARGEAPPRPWVDALSRAAGFLKAILHPDGDVPLLNDSALGEALAPGVGLDRVRAVAGDVRSRVAPAKSGFLVFRGGDIFLIADGGAPSPPYNPAHSHAGALSYEMSVFGRRAIVDAGVGGYAEGEARDYCRGTRAHNTVCVGGGSQSEMWASFRVGGRAECFLSDVKESELMTSFSGRCRWWEGSVVHSREWVVVHNAGVLVLDAVSGARGAPVEGLIHFAPEWRVEQTERRKWRCESGERVFYVTAFEPWEGRLEECRVWRRFGREEKAPLLLLRTEDDVERGAYFVGLRPHDTVEFRPSERLLVLDGWAYNC